MTIAKRFELPPDKQRVHDGAVKLEWVTIVFLVSAVVAIYLTLGASQAMKAAWIEDLLSLLPPIAFLIAARFRDKQPTPRFPYGYHRAVTLAYLVASLALLIMGTFLIYDSLGKLISFEHPSIGLVQPTGEPIWLGWFMIAALIYTSVPIAILGRMKLPLADQLHDKVLYADAEMNRADWMTGAAAIVGVVGIGFGLWWLDAVAALVISVDIFRDGLHNVSGAVNDLMNERPTTIDHSRLDPLPARIETELEALPWVEEARVRIREEGHVYFGEAVVVLRDQRNLVANIDSATERLLALDWKLHDLKITPTAELPAEVPDPTEGSGT